MIYHIKHEYRKVILFWIKQICLKRVSLYLDLIGDIYFVEPEP